jgi:hypothetical protein
METKFWELAILICSAVGFLWKSWYDTRKISKLVNERLKGVENGQTKMITDFSVLNSGINFERKLRNALKVKSLTILKYGKINVSVGNALTNFEKEIEELFISYWGFEDRHKPLLLEYVNKELKSIISNLELSLNHIFPEPKSIVSNGKNTYLAYMTLVRNCMAYDFTNEIQPNVVNILIKDLGENNLDNEALKIKAITFIDEFYSKILGATDIYENIKESKVNIDM